VLRLTRDGKQVFEWQTGSFGYAHDFIEGEHPEMDLPTLQELAALLGRLHILTDDFEAFPAQVDWLDELETAIERAESCATDPQWGTQAGEVAATLRGLPDFGDLPTGLIHTDVHEGNLLRTPGGKLYMLDWEDAGLGEMIFDLALVLGWNCVWPISKNLSGQVTRYDFDEEWSKAFLSAYQQVRPITGHEAQHLGAAIRFVMGWFAARDIAREVAEPGISDELAFTNWAIMRSVTPRWDATLAQWVKETRPATPNLPE
jgi:Ser/Thr protein kinase RdoA (MazF antagonist)